MRAKYFVLFLALCLLFLPEARAQGGPGDTASVKGAFIAFVISNGFLYNLFGATRERGKRKRIVEEWLECVCRSLESSMNEQWKTVVKDVDMQASSVRATVDRCHGPRTQFLSKLWYYVLPCPKLVQPTDRPSDSTANPPVAVSQTHLCDIDSESPNNAVKLVISNEQLLKLSSDEDDIKASMIKVRQWFEQNLPKSSLKMIIAAKEVVQAITDQLDHIDGLDKEGREVKLKQNWTHEYQLQETGARVKPMHQVQDITSNTALFAPDGIPSSRLLPLSNALPDAASAKGAFIGFVISNGFLYKLFGAKRDREERKQIVVKWLKEVCRRLENSMKKRWEKICRRVSFVRSRLVFDHKCAKDWRYALPCPLSVQCDSQSTIDQPTNSASLPGTVSQLSLSDSEPVPCPSLVERDPQSTTNSIAGETASLPDTVSQLSLSDSEPVRTELVITKEQLSELSSKDATEVEQWLEQSLQNSSLETIIATTDVAGDIIKQLEHIDSVLESKDELQALLRKNWTHDFELQGTGAEVGPSNPVQDVKSKAALLPLEDGTPHRVQAQQSLPGSEQQSLGYGRPASDFAATDNIEGDSAFVSASSEGVNRDLSCSPTSPAIAKQTGTTATTSTPSISISLDYVIMYIGDRETLALKKIFDELEQFHKERINLENLGNLEKLLDELQCEGSSNSRTGTIRMLIANQIFLAGGKFQYCLQCGCLKEKQVVSKCHVFPEGLLEEYRSVHELQGKCFIHDCIKGKEVGTGSPVIAPELFCHTCDHKASVSENMLVQLYKHINFYHPHETKIEDCRAHKWSYLYIVALMFFRGLIMNVDMLEVYHTSEQFPDTCFHLLEYVRNGCEHLGKHEHPQIFQYLVPFDHEPDDSRKLELAQYIYNLQLRSIGFTQFFKEPNGSFLYMQFDFFHWILPISQHFSIENRDKAILKVRGPMDFPSNEDRKSLFPDFLRQVNYKQAERLQRYLWSQGPESKATDSCRMFIGLNQWLRNNVQNPPPWGQSQPVTVDHTHGDRTLTVKGRSTLQTVPHPILRHADSEAAEAAKVMKETKSAVTGCLQKATNQIKTANNAYTKCDDRIKFLSNRFSYQMDATIEYLQERLKATLECMTNAVTQIESARDQMVLYRRM